MMLPLIVLKSSAKAFDLQSYFNSTLLVLRNCTLPLCQKPCLQSDQSYVRYYQVAIQSYFLLFPLCSLTQAGSWIPLNACSLTSEGWGIETEGRKWEISWVKIVWWKMVYEVKQSWMCSQSKPRSWFITSHWWTDIQPFPGKLGFITPNGYLERQIP